MSQTLLPDEPDTEKPTDAGGPRKRRRRTRLGRRPAPQNAAEGDDRGKKPARLRKRRKRGSGRAGQVLARHRQMRETSTQKIYDLHSKFYDATFGQLVKKRIGLAIENHVKLSEGQTILDVGIGTGASLKFYPQDRGQIIGVDLSGGMLDKAYEKIDETGRENAALARANALTLPFADDSFDTVFVSHVITVVSDPVELMKECCRVGRPGARIVMVNHFQSENRAVAAIEKLVCPICTKLGWRSDLPLQELVEKTGLQVDYRYKLTTPDLWETVVITNHKPAK